MESGELTAFYQLFGELVEFIGDDRWNDYVRYKRITEGY
ncbi:hypothetical protein HMPREF0631_1362 [Peptostreptococcus anaerobius 653-L]|uniref:Uncharacterized protein n=1 Tax=Peptostreptococcus anaerobius 653-L TaxID=596329 RepID=D3MU56_9FIRM|nr:hypothetical protein HMPREF0631_1362 [Peptostreptococcus anaerobius 653-L]